MTLNIQAESLVLLPFKLDLCAVGPDVPPLNCQIGEANVSIHFPPSLSEGTDGQGIYGDWAWWKGDRLQCFVEFESLGIDDVESLREIAIEAAEEALRRFLNTVRDRFDRHDVHPVRVDPKNTALFSLSDEGQREALAEPFDSFFYRNLPKDPPLATSINTTTLDDLKRDVAEAREPSVARQLELDARALEEQGEYLRADLLRGLARQQL